MPNDGGPKTGLAADSDETGQLSARTLLLRDFGRRAPAFLGIASNAQGNTRARCITEKTKTEMSEKKEEPVKKEIPVSGGGGFVSQSIHFYYVKKPHESQPAFELNIGYDNIAAYFCQAVWRKKGCFWVFLGVFVKVFFLTGFWGRKLHRLMWIIVLLPKRYQHALP
jgi:hypothetical protein